MGSKYESVYGLVKQSRIGTGFESLPRFAFSVNQFRLQLSFLALRISLKYYEWSFIYVSE